MNPKPCSLCGQPADVSFVILASTLRISPRQQKSSAAVPFCKACLRLSVGQDSPDPYQTLSDALTTAKGAFLLVFARFSEEVRTNDDHSKGGSESASDAQPGASCRPSLTACNSRHFDEVPDPEEPDR